MTQAEKSKGRSRTDDVSCCDLQFTKLMLLMSRSNRKKETYDSNGIWIQMFMMIPLKQGLIYAVYHATVYLFGGTG